MIATSVHQSTVQLLPRLKFPVLLISVYGQVPLGMHVSHNEADYHIAINSIFESFNGNGHIIITSMTGDDPTKEII
jgi:hypothetical protein